jgi:hypothetical protein
MTGVPTGHHGAVLAGVKAKPSGWPAASPDPGSGRHKPAVIRRRVRTNDKIKPTKGVSTVSGDCRGRPGSWVKGLLDRSLGRLIPPG